MDSCFTNKDGQIVPTRDGHFSRTCHDCFLADAVNGRGLIFQCRCDPIPGRTYIYPGKPSLRAPKAGDNEEAES